MMTWFGGIVCVPRACRIKLRTMRIRVKEVIINKMAGAMERIVRIATIRIAGIILSGESVSLRLTSMLGRLAPEAQKLQNSNIKVTLTNIVR